MKNSMIKSGILAVALFGISTLAPSNAKAQGVGQLANGLLNVQVAALIGDINVPIDIDNLEVLTDLIDGGVINIGDITINGISLVNIRDVNITDVLNNNQVRVLTNFLNRSPILSNNQQLLTDFLNDLEVLTDFEILEDGQVVVGILNGVLFVQDN